MGCVTCVMCTSVALLVWCAHGAKQYNKLKHIIKENVNQHYLVVVKCKKDKNNLSEKVKKKILNSTTKLEKKKWHE